jgi:hypothetical protein
VTDWNPIVVPEQALLILEKRLREQEAEGVRMPEAMGLDELALRILIAADTGRVPAPSMRSVAAVGGGGRAECYSPRMESWGAP